MEYENYKIENFHRYKMAENFIDTALKFQGAVPILKAQIQNLNLRFIDEKKIADVKEIVKFKVEPHIAILKTKTKKIIQISNVFGRFYLEDLNTTIKMPVNLYFSFMVSILVLSLIYFYLLRRLKPLTILRKKIKELGEGNTDIEIKIDGNDEISEVADEFNKAIQKIKKLDHSRKLFLRNIMHELKTPLVKCRISAEMLEDDKNKQRIIKAANRMDNLIDKLAKIEEITSGNYHLDIQKYEFSEILSYVFEILMIEKENIEVEKDMPILMVDFELFSIVVKNLIDNALKYSQDKKAIINFKEKKIIFISKAKPLKENFEHYLKPFAHSSCGMGLGLYIVNEILKLHHFVFDYKHQDGKNLFIIITKGDKNGSY